MSIGLWKYICVVAVVKLTCHWIKDYALSKTWLQVRETRAEDMEETNQRVCAKAQTSVVEPVVLGVEKTEPPELPPGWWKCDTHRICGCEADACEKGKRKEKEYGQSPEPVEHKTNVTRTPDDKTEDQNDKSDTESPAQSSRHAQDSDSFDHSSISYPVKFAQAIHSTSITREKSPRSD
jgi:hypothetical protein